jgi:hypothetical protein
MDANRPFFFQVSFVPATSKEIAGNTIPVQAMSVAEVASRDCVHQMTLRLYDPCRALRTERCIKPEVKRIIISAGREDDSESYLGSEIVATDRKPANLSNCSFDPLNDRQGKFNRSLGNTYLIAVCLSLTPVGDRLTNQPISVA